MPHPSSSAGRANLGASQVRCPPVTSTATRILSETLAPEPTPASPHGADHRASPPGPGGVDGGSLALGCRRPRARRPGDPCREGPHHGLAALLETAQQRRPRTRSGGRTRRAAQLGQDGRTRRAARRGHVRCDLRVPAAHGPQPAARGDDERHRHPGVPADHQQQGAELPRLVGILRRRRHRDLRPGRQPVAAHRRAVRRRGRAVHHRPDHPLHGLRRRAPGAAAGRHRRRGHAHRVQPRARRRRRLLAAGPVDRVHRHARRRRPERRPARVPRTHRDLLVADLRLCAQRDRGPRARPARQDRAATARSPTPTGSTGRTCRPPTGSACPPPPTSAPGSSGPPATSSASTRRASASASRSSPCPWSSR